MNLDDMRATQELAAGDACEWRYPARSEWNPGRVVSNGGSGYWKVEDDLGGVHGGLYIEHVRAPGTDPWGA